jgi:HEAT repeat protein
MMDRLLQIARPENEFTSRACAVDLLGSITDPRVDVALNEYKNDPDRRVRFYAIFGLAKRSPEGCKALTDLWKSPDITAPERNDIVARIASTPTPASPESVIEILHSAIQDPAIEESLRLASIAALGQLGKSESLAPLAVCAEKDPSQTVKEAAKSASDAIATGIKN